MEKAPSFDNRFARPRAQLKNRQKNRLKRISPGTFWVSLGAFLVILPLLFGSTVMIYFQIEQLNLPGVFVYDKPVGLNTYQETINQIDADWNLNRRINLIYENDPAISFSLSPAELGIWVDSQKTAEAAYSIGRSTKPFDDILASIQEEPHIVYPVLYFDEKIAKETLIKMDEELAIQAQDAQITYQDGQWIAIPGSEGRKIDIGITIDELYKNAFDILITGSAPIAMSYPMPTIVDLTPVLGEIDQVISQELSITAYDPIEDETFNWRVPIEIKRSWVSLKPEDYSVSMVYQDDDIASLLTSWQQELGESRFFQETQPESIIDSWKSNQSPQIMIKHGPTTYQVSPGESLWSISLKLGMPMFHIMDANQGLTTNNIEAGMILDIPSKDILLPLPVVPNKRIVIDISEQRMMVYEDGQIRNSYIVSTGVSDSPTMPGVFQVQTHELNAYASNWDLYMPHFMGIYEAWPGFMNGIHGLPLLSGGQRLWASTLGSPASYGCIILDLAAAEDLYDWADPGVVVEIVR